MENIIIPMVGKVSYAKAIRKKCMDCSGGSTTEVAQCQVLDCPLFAYRFGCSPITANKRYGNTAKIK